MFQALRRRMRLNPASVIATVALVFAMTGGAYAAGRYVITSTKQIKPSVLKSLQGKTGPAGPAGVAGVAGAGAAGAQGPQGPAGSAGAKGENGAPGANGESVSNKVLGKGSAACPEGGAEFKVGGGGATKACNGTTGFTETLPSGKTEMGEWSVTPVETELATFGHGVISFVIPLEAAPTAVYIKEGQGGKEHEAECPGTAENPKAAEGFLCVYAFKEGAEGAPEVAFTEATPSSFGALLIFNGKFTGFPISGSWAVSAP